VSALLSEPVRTPSLLAPLPAPGPVRAATPDPRRWRDGPTPASLADLLALTRTVAAEVADGRHTVELDPEHRWSRRLHADDHLDVWLISWTTEQSAELHDHGGSLGALTVVRGALTEWRWTAGASEDDATCPAEELAARGPGLRRRVIDAGGGVGFGLGHVHDVGNRALEPAVSVHAYSPPLSAMSYYAVEGGVLRRRRSELVDPGTPPE
jgi:predicted metal-dependent enzyme (double-stranded beta helix superfamily)